MYPIKHYKDEGFVERKIEINEEDLPAIIEEYLLAHGNFHFDEIEIVNNRPMNIWLHAKCRTYIDPPRPKMNRSRKQKPKCRYLASTTAMRGRTVSPRFPLTSRPYPGPYEFGTGPDPKSCSRTLASLALPSFGEPYCIPSQLALSYPKKARNLNGCRAFCVHAPVLKPSLHHDPPRNPDAVSLSPRLLV